MPCDLSAGLGASDSEPLGGTQQATDYSLGTRVRTDGHVFGDQRPRHGTLTGHISVTRTRPKPS